MGKKILNSCIILLISEEIIFEENISKIDTSLQNVPQNIETHNTNEAIAGQNDGDNETALDVRTQHTLETEMKELIGQNELNGLMEAFPKVILACVNMHLRNWSKSKNYNTNNS